MYSLFESLPRVDVLGESQQSAAGHQQPDGRRYNERAEHEDANLEIRSDLPLDSGQERIRSSRAKMGSAKEQAMITLCLGKGKGEAEWAIETVPEGLLRRACYTAAGKFEVFSRPRCVSDLLLKGKSPALVLATIDVPLMAHRQLLAALAVARYVRLCLLSCNT